MKRTILLLAFLSLCLSVLLPNCVFAHEAYVLPREVFNQGLKIFTPNPLAALFHPEYLPATAVITAIVVILYTLNFVWAATSQAATLDKLLKKFSNWGLLLVRLAIAASFLYGALGNNIFGPELSLTTIPGGQLILGVKIVVGLLLAVGLLTRLAAGVGLVIYLYVLFRLGPYLLTYLNYFGELLVLTLYGSWFLSIDTVLFNKQHPIKILVSLRDWEVPLVRIFYGLALIYAAISIKFLHQAISVQVYQLYHLERFFHGPADYIAAGAGLSELAVGFFILIGFGQRLTVFISLIFITLSLLFFREAVWPHLMLYGIGVLIFIDSGDKLTVDRYLLSPARKILARLGR